MEPREPTITGKRMDALTQSLVDGLLIVGLASILVCTLVGFAVKVTYEEIRESSQRH